MKIVRCPECNESFPDYLFEFGISFQCDCGQVVEHDRGIRTQNDAPLASANPGPGDRGREDAARPLQASIASDIAADGFGEQDRRARELRRRADRISYLIVSTDTPLRQIEFEMRTLRERCVHYFPEIRGAYEQVYGARFQKLWREFRQD